jgi:hypothetical protein
MTEFLLYLRMLPYFYSLFSFLAAFLTYSRVKLEQFIWQWGWISTWLIRIKYKMNAFSRDTVPQTMRNTTNSKNSESLTVNMFYCRTVSSCSIFHQVVISASSFTTQSKKQLDCYHSVQNLVSFSLLSNNIRIKIHRTKILPVVCMGVKLGRSQWGRKVG